MLILYDKETKAFDNLGIGILRDLKSEPEITEVLNGLYNLEFEYVKGGWLSEYLVEGNIIKANGQTFRIRNISKSMDGSGIKILAKHTFFDLEKNNFLEDVAPTDKTGDQALAWLLEHTKIPNSFSVTGNCTKIASARYVRMNPIEAIYNADNALLTRFGGEIEIDNNNITLHEKRGNNLGLEIRQKKNLKGAEYEVDLSTLATRIMPIGKDGILLPEKYVDSSLINNYYAPFFMKYEVDVGVDEENGISLEDCYTKMRDAVQTLFENGIDKPTVSIKIDFVELAKTLEYKEYSNLEAAHLGDTCKAYIPSLNLNLTTRIVKTVYNCSKERITKVELGTPKPNYVSNKNNIDKIFTNAISKDNSNGILNLAKDNATSMLKHPFKGYLYINEETGELFLMDTNDINTAQKIWKFGLGGIGFSSTGINGNFGIAITQDGRIVADYITTGTLSASRVEGYNALQQKVVDIDSEVKDNYTELLQTINALMVSVQNTGGDNLLLNSVMFAQENNGSPKSWDVTGSGTITIGASGESIANGALSGHAFKLQNKTVKQRVVVKVDDSSIPEDRKTYYSFSTRIKKGNVGSCYVKIYNSKEEHKIEIPAGQSSYWQEFQLKSLLPKENYYFIEFYGSNDSDSTFTDNMFAVGNYPIKWCQANGEIMNTQVKINVDGVLVNSAVYEGDYTVMSPLEFAGYSKINGVITKIFTINKDTTIVEKLESKEEIKMEPIKVVPVLSGPKKGWHFVKSS